MIYAFLSPRIFQEACVHVHVCVWEWGDDIVCYLFSEVSFPVQKPEEETLKPFIIYKLVTTDVPKRNLVPS